MGKQQQRKQQPNWFAQQNQRYGENWITLINAEEMQKGAIRLFRDIARGNINIPKDGAYFTNVQFIDNCIVAANSKIIYYGLLLDGLNALSTTNPEKMRTSNSQAVYRNVKMAFEGYGFIVQAMLAIRASGDYVSNLGVLVNNLIPYKYSL